MFEKVVVIFISVVLSSLCSFVIAWWVSYRAYRNSLLLDDSIKKKENLMKLRTNVRRFLESWQILKRIDYSKINSSKPTQLGRDMVLTSFQQMLNSQKEIRILNDSEYEISNIQTVLESQSKILAYLHKSLGTPMKVVISYREALVEERYLLTLFPEIAAIVPKEN